jgi:arylsulfatase A-like enzyme
MKDPARPDVFLIVADCVSEEGFAAATRSNGFGDYIGDFLRTSVRPSGAVTVAPWTLPSHVSLLTGRYPWETSQGTSKYEGIDGSGVRTLARELKDLGYRTLCLSANCLISPSSGLTGEFDRSAWGRWWDIYLRDGRREPPHESPTEGGLSATPAVPERPNPLLDAAPLLARNPELGKFASRVVQRIRNGSGGTDARIGTWIEPTLKRWLGSLSTDVPVFCLVNLMDAHEPYYSEGSELPVGYRLPRQDRVGWLLGRWAPSADDQRALESLYHLAIRRLLRRVDELIGIIDHYGRWDPAVAVLTSDHGQSFGGRQPLFHSQGTADSLLRVPMQFKLPNFEPARWEERSWVSLIDVTPTILHAVGRPPGELPSGIALQDDPQVSARRPVFAFSAGLDPTRAGLADPDIRRAIDGLRVTGYLGRWKVTVGPGSNDVEVCDLESDPMSLYSVRPASPLDQEALRAQVEALHRRLSAAAAASPAVAVDQRLRSWGY